MSILLITVDCLRADHVGIYGYDRPTTPSLDELAIEGEYFQGFSNSPGTRWALQVIHTGVYNCQLGGIGIPRGGPSNLAQVFKSNGYSTGGFAHNGFLSREYNYNYGFDQFVGVQDFSDNKRDNVKSKISSALPDKLIESFLAPSYNKIRSNLSANNFRPPTTDSDIVDKAVDWISDQEKEWFCWVHLMDAHTPYGRWDKHLNEIRGDTNIRHVIHPHYLVKDNKPDQATIDAYDSGVRSADTEISRLIDCCDDTVNIVVTGDHGEEFGKFGDFHSASVHSSMSQVPLIVRPSNDAHAIQPRSVMQHIDILPTLTGLADDIEYQDTLPGSDIYHGEINDEGVYIEVKNQKAYWKEDKKIIKNKISGRKKYYSSEYLDGDIEQSNMPKRVKKRLDDGLKNMESYCKNNKLDIETGMSFDDGTNVSGNVEENLKDLGYIN